MGIDPETATTLIYGLKTIVDIYNQSGQTNRISNEDAEKLREALNTLISGIESALDRSHEGLDFTAVSIGGWFTEGIGETSENELRGMIDQMKPLVET